MVLPDFSSFLPDFKFLFARCGWRRKRSVRLQEQGGERQGMRKENTTCLEERKEKAAFHGRNAPIHYRDRCRSLSCFGHQDVGGMRETER